MCVSLIEDGVELAEEDVSQDPVRKSVSVLGVGRVDPTPAAPGSLFHNHRSIFIPGFMCSACRGRAVWLLPAGRRRSLAGEDELRS